MVNLDPTGDWWTIHEDTHKATSVVHIAWEGNALVGRVRQILASTRGPNPRCERCAGERHNQPVLGMSILWDLRGAQGQYDGGFILDPSKGKQYRAKMKLRDANTLEVRGFVGMALLGRTQVWQRVPTSELSAAPAVETKATATTPASAPPH